MADRNAKKTALPPATDGVTSHGFRWGNADISRSCIVTKGSEERHRVVSITTPRRMVQIAITPTGLVRVTEKANKSGWMPTPRKDPRQLTFPWGDVPTGEADPMTESTQ